MYARLLALCCLLFPVASPGVTAAPDHPELLLYLRADGGSSVNLLSAMKSQLAALMRTAGYEVIWSDSHSPVPDTTGSLVVVDFLGACHASPVRKEFLGVRRAPHLGSSAVADGQVLPFSWVDCAAISDTLARALTAYAPPDREGLFGRAMARVLAHELFHILGQTSAHTRTGLTKARLSPEDLLAEQFGYSSAALTSLRLHSAPKGVADRSDGSLALLTPSHNP